MSPLRSRLLLLLLAAGAAHAQTPAAPVFDDGHIHLTNYVQEGPSARDLLRMMGSRIHRATLFGIPLQQQWSYRISGNHAPTYYLQTDAPLYYYSFTDAAIAEEFLSLGQAERARFDPMITGFNPADMYATDHVRRVLQTFPGVFEGIGEFTVHKEFVSSKIAGEVPSLKDPALDRLFDFCAEAGLVVLIHNDMTFPLAKRGERPAYFEQMRSLLKRHPKTTVIWAHLGLGRVISPVERHAATLQTLLEDPQLKNLYFDISWSEVAKYVVASPETTRIAAELINRHPDRFLYGSDALAPTDPKKLFEVFDEYQPLWKLLTPKNRALVQRGNYERLFDEARQRVRAWEAAHPKR